MFHYHLHLTTLVLSLLLLTISCAPLEEVAEEPEETTVAAEEAGGSEEIWPDWFNPETSAQVTEGLVISFASAPGSDVEWARNHAESQVLANLRVWVDTALEQARDEVSNSTDQASERDLILQLRNAVHALDLSNVEVTSEHLERDNGTVHVFVKAEVPSTVLLDEIGTQLPGYEGIWRQMLASQPLSEWQ